MNEGIIVGLQSIIFAVINLIIAVKSRIDNQRSKAKRLFGWLAMTGVVMQLFEALALLVNNKELSISATVLHIICTLMFTAMTMTAFLWFRYLCVLVPGPNKSGRLFDIASFIPVVVIIVMGVISYWTKWMFYIDENVQYQRGPLLIVELLCPYSYLAAATIMIIRNHIKGGPQRISKVIKTFMLILIPSLIGVVIQMFFNIIGGYIQIGISVGILLIYLDVFSSEVKKSELLQEVSEYNEKLKKAYDDQEEQLEKIKKLNIQLEEQREELEYQQRRERLQMETMAEAIHGGFKISKNDKFYTFNYVSEQLANMLGYSVEEFMQASKGTMAGIVNLDDVGEELKKARADLDAGYMYTMNYRMRCKDGSWKYVEDRGRRIRTVGDEYEFWCFISDKEELAEKSKALDIAQKANDAKTIFLNNMSHDIRTPMNAILGFSKLMEKKLSQPEVLSEYLGKIQTAGAYLLEIINNILDMARIESGSVEIDEGFADLFENCKNAEIVFEEEFRRKNLKFTDAINIEHQYVMMDSTKNAQIIVNLLSNAVKYTPDGGSITITMDELPDEKEGYATYVIKVSDTGIGMSKEFVSKVFDSFSRERNTTESKVSGTGLGMSIVKKLVELQGGTVEVESELGKGTTFIVTLSYKIIENSEEYTSRRFVIDAETDLSILKGRRVLLAEDNDLNAQIASIILNDVGITVERAEDGVECVNMLNKAVAGYYDLILMDIQMPNLNGYQATEKIRELPDKDKAEIPIIAMTANAFDDDKKLAIRAGMNAHLSKPIDTTAMMKTLKAIVKNEYQA